MTKQQFNNLKTGDRIYCFNNKNRNSLFSTQVLSIDRPFGKLTAVCSSKPKSYKYFKIKGDKPVTFYVGCAPVQKY